MSDEKLTFDGEYFSTRFIEDLKSPLRNVAKALSMIPTQTERRRMFRHIIFNLKQHPDILESLKDINADLTDLFNNDFFPPPPPPQPPPIVTFRARPNPNLSAYLRPSPIPDGKMEDLSDGHSPLEPYIDRELAQLEEKEFDNAIRNSLEDAPLVVSHHATKNYSDVITNEGELIKKVYVKSRSSELNDKFHRMETSSKSTKIILQRHFMYEAMEVADETCTAEEKSFSAGKIHWEKSVRLLEKNSIIGEEEEKIMRLCIINPHSRDSRISRILSGDSRQYVLDNHQHLMGSTSLIKSYFPQFDADTVLSQMRSRPSWKTGKYNGMTDEEIKAMWNKDNTLAADLGTAMHERIENFYDLNVDDWETAFFRSIREGETPENLEKERKKFEIFEKFRKKKGWKIRRVEWLIWDAFFEVAGMIDAVFENPEGELVVVDWKRSKEIKLENRFECIKEGPTKGLDNCNYEHYRLQASLYAYILKKRYKLVVAEHAYIVSIHPNYDEPNIIEVKVDTKMVLGMLREIKKNKEPEKKKKKIVKPKKRKRSE